MLLYPSIILSMIVLVFLLIVLFSSLYVLFIHKRARPQEYYHHDRPFVFGHRGSPTKITENTILSFEKAIEQGVDGLEFDIRLSKDKKIVIFHDADLQRLARINKKIKNLNHKQIQEISLKQEQTIPLLDDIVPLIAKVKALNIEIKSEGLFYNQEIVVPLVQFLNKYDRGNKFIISSFNPLILWRLKLQRPKTIIGYLYNRNKFFHSVSNLVWIARIRPDNLHIHYSLLNSWIVRWARHKGLRINSYTINKRDIYHKAKEQKIDGVFTDNIEYIK